MVRFGAVCVTFSSMYVQCIQVTCYSFLSGLEYKIIKYAELRTAYGKLVSTGFQGFSRNFQILGI